MAKKKERKVWRFTEPRKNALRKAQREHVRLVRLGESVDAKRRKR